MNRANLLNQLARMNVPAAALSSATTARNRLPPRPQPALQRPVDLPDADRLGLKRDALLGAGEEVLRGEMPDLFKGGAKPLARAAGRSARSMFKPTAFDDIEGFKSRSKIVEMGIDEFLNLAKKLTGRGISTSEKVLASGRQLDSIPQLKVESEGAISQVMGHEGRNRALALKKRGFDTMPVEIRDLHIRFGEQADPSSMDFVKEFPTRLISESGDFTTRFPVPSPRGGP